jgi:lipopolysaccharide/colanic/teichoic acid biosynthesis glycosyltransferase
VGIQSDEPQVADMGPRRQMTTVLEATLADAPATFRSTPTPTHSRRRYIYAKRGLDLCLASCILLVLVPLMVVVALVIVLVDGGPVFYRRTMIGWNGTRFRMWKFRSMVNGAEEMLLEDASLYTEYRQRDFKLPQDPRVTRIGRLLRKHSLDELPQLWNVITGDMSLVGPRAIHPIERSLFGEFAAERERIRPGVTGLWQVSGRSDTGYDERIRLDREYVEHCSLWMDIRILLRTVVVVITGVGAY